MPECHLISGYFAIFIQAVLGALCVLTLIIKRMTEVPRRDWDVWLYDASKQGVGSTLSHFSNIVLSVFLNSDAKLSQVDECQWYCLSFLNDSTVGIAINLTILTFVEYLMSKTSRCSHIKFGDYGNPTSFYKFLPQLLIWLVIVCVTKVFTYTSQLRFLSELLSVTGFVLSPVLNSPKLELVIVMIIIPVVINSIQFWLTDMFLKKDSAPSAANIDEVGVPIDDRVGRNGGHKWDEDGIQLMQTSTNDDDDDEEEGLEVDLLAKQSGNKVMENSFLFYI